MIHIRLMTADDLAFGMRLKTQAGWNQIEADWLRFIDMQPDGCFVAELDSVPVGTTTTTRFADAAWVSLVLVDAAVRGRGVGKALMAHALAFLDAQGVRTVRLDATQLGQPLYEKLGFVVEYALVRYDGVLLAADDLSFSEVDSFVRAGSPHQWEEVFQLDRTLTGTDRRKMLLRLFRERPDALRVLVVDRWIEGYLTVRPGAVALQLGPCLATTEKGALLLGGAWQRYAGQRVFLDVPTDNVAAVGLAEGMGLQAARTLVRMRRGPALSEDRACLWASSGPELG